MDCINYFHSWIDLYLDGGDGHDSDDDHTQIDAHDDIDADDRSYDADAHKCISCYEPFHYLAPKCTLYMY